MIKKAPPKGMDQKSRISFGRSRPIALVVQANVANEAAGEDNLTETKEEATKISDLLFSAGYDVHLLTSGRYKELSDLLADNDICQRLVVFHYCGHAHNDLVSLFDENGNPKPISAQGLSMQMKTEAKALRIVYINGCKSESQDDDYRDSFPNVNFIGTRIAIPDYFARIFAVSFYKTLVGTEAPHGTTSVARALDFAAGEDIAKKPERVPAVMSLTSSVRDAEAADTSESIENYPDVLFQLDEGSGLIASHVLDQWQHRRPSVALMYVGFVIFSLGLLLWFAHVAPVTSSPAFQAAFSYIPDCETLKGVAARATELAKTESAPDAPKFSIGNCESANSVADPLGGRSPTFGFLIEWIRTITLCGVMLVISTLIYRDMPRDYPEFFSRQIWDWIKFPKHRFFVGLCAVGVVGIAIYHFTFAHWSLAGMKLADWKELTWLQARWPAYHDPSSAIWAQFTDLKERLAQGPKIADITWEDDGYYQLFVRPYMYYLGYSIGNYLVTALPILTIIVHGYFFGAARMKLRLADLKVNARLTRDGFFGNSGYIDGLLGNIRAEMSEGFSKFAVTFLLVTLFAAYEVFLGRTTTAIFAQIITWLVFLMVLVGVLHVGMLWNAYSDSLKKISSLIEQVKSDAARDRVNSFRESMAVAYAPITKTTILILVVATALFLYLLYVLALGKHWTVFTHPTPSFLGCSAENFLECVSLFK